MGVDDVVLSVRDLVEFILRSGSIDNRFSGFDRAQMGARIHRQLQKNAGPDYSAEVTLKDTTTTKGITFFVQGRADGIIRNALGVTIDEIKTTAMDLALLEEEDRPVHWAQAKCYAWFVAKEEGLSSISVRLTYCQIETRETRFFIKVFRYEELEAFYLELLGEYLHWARMKEAWGKKRNQSAVDLEFPYPKYRRGQREMAVAVYNTIRRQERLFCQAPTGIGKTLSVLFPSMKALAQGFGHRVFYLTAKTITRQVAEETVALLRQKGLRAKGVTLTAKDKICFLEERSCNPEDCPYARDYFSKVNGVVYAMLAEEEAFTRPVIEKWARDAMLCPFELSLDLAGWVDIIIGDYNYLFDPVVALQRLFNTGERDSLFLVDEGHNLVDRARGMYSASLRKSSFLALKRSLGGKKDSFYKAVDKANQAFILLRKQNEGCRDQTYKESRTPFNEAIMTFGFAYEAFSKKHPEHPALQDSLELYFAVRNYLMVSEYYDEAYITSVTCFGSEVIITQHCLDPSKILSATMELGRSTILFSATLTPMDYYMQVLGGGEQARKYALPSPFSPEHLGLLLADEISTRYTLREASYTPIAEMIAAFISGRPGNYMVFFPSYAYLEAVRFVFEEMAGEGVEVLSQHSEMDEAEREAFLARFEASSDITQVAFCVMGGIFSEGIDLKGDCLIGAVIVGVGLPQVGMERNILKTYYDEKMNCGFDYAYKNPGMNKVLQSLGRVIRDEGDLGMVLLIDERFSRYEYRRLLPSHLQHLITVSTPDEVKARAQAFWQREKNSRDAIDKKAK